MKYTDIKNQEDACKVLKREPKAGEELKDIADAMNFLDNNYKPGKKSWYPLFWWDEAGGFGFQGSFCDPWTTLTLAGSRLAYRFRAEAAADYFGGEQFIDLHKKQFYS